jgi:hypothetical protein
MKGFKKNTGPWWIWILFLAVSTALSAQVDTRNTQTVTVTISPPKAAVTAATQTQQFTASPTAVTWSVDGVAGGNVTVGTISTTGLYTPPATAGTHTIKAIDGTASATATIAVTDLLAVLT